MGGSGGMAVEERIGLSTAGERFLYEMKCRVVSVNWLLAEIEEG